MNRKTSKLHKPGTVAIWLLAIFFLGASFSNNPKSLVPLNSCTGDSTYAPTANPLSLLEAKKELYFKLGLEGFGLSRKVFEMALKGMDKLLRKDKIRNPILSIVDFSKPSTAKRLYVIDLEQESLVFNTWVAHGRNSGAAQASLFSNKPRSRKSSLGFYLTANSYYGSNGYSLKLEGVEPGFNSNAGARGIVIHGANYVGEQFIDQLGYLGRSQGCPAVNPEVNEPLINTIKEGSCLFIYHPSPTYTQRSIFLR